MGAASESRPPLMLSQSMNERSHRRARSPLPRGDVGPEYNRSRGGRIAQTQTKVGSDCQPLFVILSHVLNVDGLTALPKRANFSELRTKRCAMLKPARTPIPECDQCLAKGISIFADLTANQVESISETKVCKHYRKGQIIFFAGDSPNGLYCLQRGKVKLYKHGKDDKEQIVRLAKAGDLIGYRSLLSGETYSAFAVPMEDSILCYIPKSVFLSLLTANQNFSMRVLKLLSEELRHAEDRIVDMAQKPAKERLAEALLLLKDTYGLKPDNQTLNVVVTREELANIIGSATESTIRILSDFRQEGSIDFVGRKIRIIDQQALLKAANLFD